jgi:glycosyltransferase involved in cell wall biosynthesis
MEKGAADERARRSSAAAGAVASMKREATREGPRRRRVLVVGQTPPPVHGQSLAIELLLSVPLEGLELTHLRLSFSRSLSEIGVPRLRKLGHLLALSIRIVWHQIRCPSEVLYYCPAGPDRVPFWRDIALLAVARPLFRRVLFSFHAGGLTGLVPRLTAPERWLFRKIYAHPDGAVRPAPCSAEEARLISAGRDWVVPNGVPDHAAETPLAFPTGPPGILFVGAMLSTKGIDLLLDAAAILRTRSIPYQLDFVGGWPAREAEAAFRERVRALGFENSVRLHGELQGEAKWARFRSATVFCFPTHYERELAPLVLIEAMQFSLPIVATSWRGIPFMIRDDDNGLLVPPLSPEATADALERLLKNPELRQRMGERGRAHYEERFTAERYLEGMRRALLEV